jgi:cytochrome c-type biogenesis protein CcmH/NrfF
MHRDIIALVNGGYDAQEILDAFVNVYGERALMAPTKSGFNLVGWLMPGIAFGVGAAALTVLLKRWGSRSRSRVANGR